MTLADVEITFKEDMAEKEDIVRCLRSLLLTPVGTCPLYRDFGINNDYLDLPMPVAKNRLAVEIMNKVEEYEPRVSVSEVDIEEVSIDGNLTLKVVVESGI